MRCKAPAQPCQPHSREVWDFPVPLTLGFTPRNSVGYSCRGRALPQAQEGGIKRNSPGTPLHAASSPHLCPGWANPWLPGAPSSCAACRGKQLSARWCHCRGEGTQPQGPHQDCAHGLSTQRGSDSENCIIHRHSPAALPAGDEQREDVEGEEDAEAEENTAHVGLGCAEPGQALSRSGTSGDLPWVPTEHPQPPQSLPDSQVMAGDTITSSIFCRLC